MKHAMIGDWAMHLIGTSNGPTGNVINSSLPGDDLRENVSTPAIKYDWQNELGKELFLGYSPALLTFASVCCLVYMMVGVPGNLITIIALFRCKKVGILQIKN